METRRHKHRTLQDNRNKRLDESKDEFVLTSDLILVPISRDFLEIEFFQQGI